MGSPGELINTAVADTLVESLPCLSDRYAQFNLDELLMFLWGLLACSARRYLDKNTGNENNNLEYRIKDLCAYLKNVSIDGERQKRIMALAAGWLGRECLVEPLYRSVSSTRQSVFHAQLQSALPLLKIEQEKGLHSLPPVDLFLPEHNIAIEIQGPSHYVGHDFQIRNGSTLLKIALLQKAGYDVLEIPVNQLDNPNSVRVYVDLIQQKTTGDTNR